MKIEFKNIWVQLTSWVLLAFTFSGLDVIPDVVSERIWAHITNQDFLTLGIYILGNLLNVFVHWYKQLKTDPKKFWAFVDSVNFWLGGANILTGLILIFTGVEIDPESVREFIAALFSQEYWGAATVFFANILIPILKKLISKEDRTIPLTIEKRMAA